ncbi:MAG TPA: ATP synthase subunit I, partial [Acidimicrobiales bacterium]|nr:ATP synthase subunit I [Acidimicrobiales bacterium]
GLVLANFWLSAALLAWAAKISYALVMGVALFGFLVRLALVGLAVYAVADRAWVADLPLGLALVAGHLGLLFWEARSVSASLAFPALKPAAPALSGMKEFTS